MADRDYTDLCFACRRETPAREVFGPAVNVSGVALARSFHECDADHPNITHRPEGMSRRLEWWTDWRDDEEANASGSPTRKWAMAVRRGAASNCGPTSSGLLGWVTVQSSSHVEENGDMADSGGGAGTRDRTRRPHHDPQFAGQSFDVSHARNRPRSAVLLTRPRCLRDADGACL